MKKLRYGYAIVLLSTFYLFGLGQASAMNVTLACDANTESDLAGYKIYYGPTSNGPYDGNSASEGASPIVVSLSSLANPSLPEFTLSNLDRETTYLVLTAYDSEGLESGYSNQVIVLPSELNLQLDSSFTASSGVLIEPVQDIISATVSTLPASAKNVYWRKSGITGMTGQVLEITYRALYHGDIEAPVSFFVANASSGAWQSPERVQWIDGSYSEIRKANLILRENLSEAVLNACFGHKTGYYEFQILSIAVNTPQTPVIADAFIQRLSPKIAAGAYSVVVRFTTSAGNATRVRVFPTMGDAEDPNIGEQLGTDINLAAGINEFAFDINKFGSSVFYPGVYFAIQVIKNGVESISQIVPYLPGNIFGNEGDAIPPLCYETKVDINDYNFVYNGYRYNNVIVPSPGNYPAGTAELGDFDQNGLVGRSTDLTLETLQLRNNVRLQ